MIEFWDNRALRKAVDIQLRAAGCARNWKTDEWQFGEQRVDVGFYTFAFAEPRRMTVSEGVTATETRLLLAGPDACEVPRTVLLTTDEDGGPELQATLRDLLDAARLKLAAAARAIGVGVTVRLGPQ